MQQSLFVLPLVESSLERLGNDLPEGVIAGARGDNYFLNPEYKDKPDFKAFVDAFRKKTNAYPIYPVFHIGQSLFALRNAYEKATAAERWPMGAVNRLPTPPKELRPKRTTVRSRSGRRPGTC